jgi:hypothetical protein
MIECYVSLAFLRNIFLRSMVRKDYFGVDFRIWELTALLRQFDPADLLK